MAALLGRVSRFSVIIALVVFVALPAFRAAAAPYAAYVMDARTGETLYEKNARTRLHPASLTKMMTLYIAFEEIEKGNISLDTMFTVTAKAAGQAPSRLGLKAGQKIALRYLIRAAAVKSANDAAMAIGEGIGGSEAKFAARMNRTAKAIGMTSTTFKNSNGLTVAGHLSTARDMSVLGRRLFYDFPKYYNIFSRRSTDAGMAQVNNTNRKFLDAYKGADGIKTGFTNAAGFNLTASAERGGVRIIATVFGGQSTAHRNAKMAELLDLGFKTAPANATTRKPTTPVYQADPEAALVASSDADEEEDLSGAGKTIRLVTSVAKSQRPKARPGAAPEAAVTLAMRDTIDGVLAEVVTAPPSEVEAAPIPPKPSAIAANDNTLPAAEATVVADAGTPPPGTLQSQSAALAAQGTAPAGTLEAQSQALAGAGVPPPPGTLQAQSAALAAQRTQLAEADGLPAEVQDLSAANAATAPARRAPIFAKVAAVEPETPAEQEVVTRTSTSGGRHWGITVGRFASRGEAERVLLKTQLAESATLNVGLRKVVRGGGGFDANFLGLNEDEATLACRRLQSRGVKCLTLGP